MHIDDRNKNILVSCEEPTQALDNFTITAAAKYPINFTEPGKRFALSLHYNGSNGFLFANAVKMYQFKAKDSEIKPYPRSLGNIVKYFAISNMKKTGLKGSVKVFSADYKPINTSEILDIHRFLTKEM